MAVKKSIDKFKKKKWFTIMAPEVFGKLEIGKTLCEKTSSMENRTMKVSFDQISTNRRLRYLQAIFKLDKIEKDKVFTKLIGHKADTGFVKRMARRRKSKVDAIVDVITKDNLKVRIAASAMCDRKEDREKERLLRKVLIEEIVSQAKKKNFDKFIHYLLADKGAEEIAKAISSTVSVRRLEVTKSKLL